MKIVGFGDSFITVGPDNAYTNLIAKHFNAKFESYAHEGSGAWDAYFQLENYLKNNTAPDVVLFAWSASGRLYHHEVRDLCHSSVMLNTYQSDDPNVLPVTQAAKAYYENLYSVNKSDAEHTCLYYWIDKELVPKYPNTKFIHMWGFPKNYCDWADTNQMEYLHTFTAATEIRPALIHLSYLDEWPDDLANETRPNHLSPRMHQVLADNLIAAIEDYNPGLLNIKL